jgi:Transposase IS116/IS110/IS902 family
MPTGYLCREPTATVRRCGSCSAPATSSPWPPPPRPTDFAHCCWAATTPSARWARLTLTDPVLAALARRREPRDASREQAVRHGEIRRLAVAVRAGRHALAANRAQLQTIVDEMAPGLTQRRGIGAVTAAQAIVSFSHPGRCRSDAAFAALSGTSPLQASSGTVRHRLNRGGDRALNRAIHTIALTRMRCCPTTKEYVARRTAEGKSSREIRRCLKRLHRPRALPRSTPARRSPLRRWRLRRPLDKHRSVRRSVQQRSTATTAPSNTFGFIQMRPGQREKG